MAGISWPELLKAGLGSLGLKPSEFWALTPGELMMMLGTPAGSAPLTRDRLEMLAHAFPDEKRTET